jgi:hypothetical protein
VLVDHDTNHTSHKRQRQATCTDYSSVSGGERQRAGGGRDSPEIGTRRDHVGVTYLIWIESVVPWLLAEAEWD